MAWTVQRPGEETVVSVEAMVVKWSASGSRASGAEASLHSGGLRKPDVGTEVLFFGFPGALKSLVG